MAASWLGPASVSLAGKLEAAWDSLDLRRRWPKKGLGETGPPLGMRHCIIIESGSQPSSSGPITTTVSRMRSMYSRTKLTR
jgi:hypothetical protein